MTDLSRKVRTPLFPRYSRAKAFMRVLEGNQKSLVTHYLQSIKDLTGTPQNPVDWSDPDTWIPNRLNGEDAILAERIWKESHNNLNPRHVYGPYLFVNGFKLLVSDGQGFFRISDKGKHFLEDDPKTIKELDDIEGLIKLLSLVASKSKAKKAQLTPDWAEFLFEYSNFGTTSTISDTLGRRLNNLLDRKLITREGIYYAITESGLKYLEETEENKDDFKKKIRKLLASQNTSQRQILKEKLGSMNPFLFERLVGDLLEAMGYSDVTVTKAVGDKGVDVVGTIQFGITTIKEVVQVKRHQSNIQRSVLDQLRGSLPYHDAIQGSLITVGGFSKGCQEASLYPGAAPISLIDGEKLLDLLMEHEIGIKKREISFWETDHAFFEEEQGSEELS